MCNVKPKHLLWKPQVRLKLSRKVEFHPASEAKRESDLSIWKGNWVTVLSGSFREYWKYCMLYDLGCDCVAFRVLLALSSSPSELLHDSVTEDVWEGKLFHEKLCGSSKWITWGKTRKKSEQVQVGDCYFGNEELRARQQGGESRRNTSELQPDHAGGRVGTRQPWHVNGALAGSGGSARVVITGQKFVFYTMLAENEAALPISLKTGPVKLVQISDVRVFKCHGAFWQQTKACFGPV